MKKKMSFEQLVKKYKREKKRDPERLARKILGLSSAIDLGRTPLVMERSAAHLGAKADYLHRTGDVEGAHERLQRRGEKREASYKRWQAWQAANPEKASTVAKLKARNRLERQRRHTLPRGQRGRENSDIDHSRISFLGRGRLVEIGDTTPNIWVSQILGSRPVPKLQVSFLSGRGRLAETRMSRLRRRQEESRAAR